MLKETARRSLQGLLPRKQVFTDRSALIAYEADAGIDRGMPEGVVFPANLEEVIRVVKWANEQQIPLIARGAGTGLSGGAVADRGGVIVEFSLLNRLLQLDRYGRTVLVEPALINLSLDEQVRAYGLYFPPDPSSQRASTIGGNVAENSGGPHCFKYGVTTNYITGLQVVLADGSYLCLGGRALDYPEYDLHGLVTGSEGTLALITEIRARLLRNPPAVKTLLAVFNSVEQAGTAVSAIIAAGLVPATMEMMDQKITGIVEPFAHAGLPLDAGAVLIVEVDGYAQSLDAQLAEISHLLRTYSAREIRVAHSAEERQKIWLARKSAAGAITRLTPTYYTVDVTVPRSRLAEVLAEVNQICERHQLRTGHLLHAGDGNLHPMLLIPDPENKDLMSRIHQAGWEIVKFCVDMGGSLTGEHGVGIEKREYMSLMHTPVELRAMWDIKEVFDPLSLFNPGKVFPTPGKDEPGPFAGYSRYQPLLANDGAVPQKIFAPVNAEEAAQSLVVLGKVEEGSVIITGRLPEDLTAENGYRLSTARMREIKAYAPDDLTITVGAGMPLAEIQAFLVTDGKQLALASPWPTATMGGLVAANINAPLRMRYGSLRDLVLCATVVLPDGRILRTGRPIVKNVAGYDLTKVFIGSQGTLGLLTDITLKIMVKPRATCTLLWPVEDLSTGLSWAREMLPLALTASALVLVKGYQGQGMPSDYLLAYTAEGLVEDVQAELAQVRSVLRGRGAPEPQESEKITGTEIWSTLLSQLEKNAVLVRIGLPTSELPSYVEEQDGLLQHSRHCLDIANGLIYVQQAFESVEEAAKWLGILREAALGREGYAVVMEMPEALRNHLDPWGYRPEGQQIMRRLKERWDPTGVLNQRHFTL